MQARSHQHPYRVFEGYKNSNRSIMGRFLFLSGAEHKSLARQGFLTWGQGKAECSEKCQKFIHKKDRKKKRRCLGSCHATSEDRVDIAATQVGLGENRLRFGSACSQGPRETMEDVVHIIENGPCGFFFAGMLVPVCTASCGMLEEATVYLFSFCFLVCSGSGWSCWDLVGKISRRTFV